MGTATKNSLTDSLTDSVTRSKPKRMMKVALAAAFAAIMLSAVGLAFYFSSAAHAAKSATQTAATNQASPPKLKQTALSVPLYFEPNQGQTAPQVKFLAHGAGYGLFLTADDAVLKLQAPTVNARPSSADAERGPSSVIRMHLEGANSAARISGASSLPGKSNYFIGNDPSKWHRDVPQFARVQYQSVYPGVDLVYYGNQGQLEYDFEVAPGSDPGQITLSFNGASARIDNATAPGNAGDLILATSNGDIRFHAPHIYQPATSALSNDEKEIAGSFSQLADNKIGFSIGAYDHTRALVIDPELSYSTYLGGKVSNSGSESNVKIAVDSAGMAYLAGSTDSADFPVTDGSTLQTGATNIFISKINPTLSGTSSLLFATYLGGSGTDSLAGVAVDSSGNIYVAGSTTSGNFPTTTSNAFQIAPESVAQHGFLSRLAPGLNSSYSLSYSTYLSGTGTDTVTGLAIDTNQNAYVTGDTTSRDGAGNYFPANPNGFQTASNYPAGGTQFFASKINTNGSGQLSMLYSTYFGGGYPVGATAVGGGIAVDTAGSAVNMYITGTTNMPAVPGPNGEHGFPIFNAQLNCLNVCITSTNTDAFVAKINPNQPASNPVYSTYLGGSGDDTGTAVAVDTSGNSYVTGSTNSTDWTCTSCVSGYQTAFGGGTTDAFIAKIGNIVGSVYPMTYFTYLGGLGDETGDAIVVDSVQAVHIAGSTDSPTGSFPVTNAPQPAYGGGSRDAFVGSISTTLSGVGAGDFLTYLGGSGTDQGTGVAFDVFNNTYVAGTTTSANFPLSTSPFPLPYQSQLSGPQDAFLTKISSVSTLALAFPTTSPSPNPVAAGTQVAFTFTITNTGPDVANLVVFNATNLPTSGLASTPTAKVTSGSGSCGTVVGSTIPCNIPTLAVNAVATVEVDLTPAVPITVANPLSISGTVSANGGGEVTVQQPGVNVVDFRITASPAAQTINAGDTATFQIIFAPCPSCTFGYNATITPSETASPSLVTATAPTFNPTTVTLSGSGTQTTLLSIPTVARPVNTGSLLRRVTFYATWLPIGGLSLAGFGIGVSRKRRRWLIGAVLCLIAGAVVMQSACGSSSSTNTTTGGTQAGTYIVTISGSAGSSASHTFQVTLTVN